MSTSILYNMSAMKNKSTMKKNNITNILVSIHEILKTLKQ